MTFDTLTEAARMAYGCWALLLCLVSFVGILLAFTVKRCRYALLSLVPFVFAYCLWQISLTGLSHAGADRAAALAQWLGESFWRYRYAVLLTLTVPAVLAIRLCIRYVKLQITPLAIRRYTDEMNYGICYYRNNGHVIFSNACMNRLCAAMTGRLLMDGLAFRAAAEGIVPVGDKVWNFTHREKELNGEQIHELIATDVTEIHAKREALRAENQRLSKLSADLKAYGLIIDETVRRQEILQAKINIHDEMNRLLLSTVTAELSDGEELNRLFSRWEKNALFLALGAEAEQEEDGLKQPEALARALNLRLVWQSPLPEVLTQKQRELFFAAAKEAITNAVKHGQAKELTVSFAENGNRLCCTLENDGRLPGAQIPFTGGLLNLSLLAGEQGASVWAETEERFRLCLCFPE